MSREKVLRLLVVNRLLDPGSEFHVHRQWFGDSAMNELLENGLRGGRKEHRKQQNARVWPRRKEGRSSLAESCWLALPEVNWAMVLLGDPRCRPFGGKTPPALLARGYVAENARHVFERGQTSSPLVQIDCVGPPGSATRPFIAKTEPEMGLAANLGPRYHPAP